MSNDVKGRLFIKKIDIANCGRFYGSGHSILLSDSSEQNITIIVGTSGMGKTTIHNLIYWCLYGEHKEHYRDEKTEVDYGLINTDALENLEISKSVIASVTLTLHDQKGEKYVLTRELKAILNRNESNRKFNLLNNSKVPTGITFEPSVKLITKNDLGTKVAYTDERIVHNNINREFPQHLSDFFLFDGEYLIKFRNNESSQLIKDGITKISGLTILDLLRDNSKATANSLHAIIGGKNSNSSPIAAMVDRLQVDIKEIEDKIKKLKKDLEINELLHKETSEKINKNKTGNDLTIKNDKYEKQKDKLMKELNKNNKEFKDFLFEKLPLMLIRDTLNNSEKIFKELESDDKIPPSITRGAIDNILDSHPMQCVCGRKFEKNENEEEPWMILNKLKESIIDDDISQGIANGRLLINQLIDNTSKHKLTDKFKTYKITRIDKRTEIQSIVESIEECIKDLEGLLYDNNEDLGKQRDKLWKEHGSINIDLNVEIDNLEEKQTDLKKYSTELRNLLEKENKYSEELKKIDLGLAIHKFSEKLRKHIEEILIKETQTATEKYFLESAPEKHTFSGVNISKNYDIVVKDHSGLVASLAKGQAHVLGLSYVGGIRKIMHTNTFLIIDSPLHNISGNSRNEISQVFSKYLPGIQLVLLVTDSEYLHGDDEGAKPVKNILKKIGNVWKEYVIKEDTIDGIITHVVKEIDD